MRPLISRIPLLAMLLLGGCEPGVLDPAGRVASAERLILLDCFAIMLAIAVPLIIAVPVIAWWFRADNPRARRRPDWSFSGQLELLIWSVPALVVIFIAGIGWAGSHATDPAQSLDSEPLRIDVVSLDWKWLFIYPEQGVASVDRLVLPAGKPVSFRLTSSTVMNSFFVPRLGSQIYTMAGMVTKLNLVADRPGRYRGLSANYSGNGFADMAFTVDAVPAGDFEAWAERTRHSSAILDRQAYDRLAVGGVPHRALLYQLSSPNLFETIVHETGQPSASPPIISKAR